MRNKGSIFSVKTQKIADASTLGQWSKLPYPGEVGLPAPVDAAAGSWPVFFFSRDKDGRFLDFQGNLFQLKLQPPHTIDFAGRQLKMVQNKMLTVTEKEKQIAVRWGTGPATKQWTPIIDKFIDHYQLSPVRAAQVLAAVQASIYDCFILVWHSKFQWDVPRPVQMDQGIKTVLTTPKFPAYPSGHSAVAGCAAEVLSYFFPTERQSLDLLAAECTQSRFFAGVHFPADCEQGLILGRQLGKYIVGFLEQRRKTGYNLKLGSLI